MDRLRINEGSPYQQDEGTRLTAAYESAKFKYDLLLANQKNLRAGSKNAQLAADDLALAKALCDIFDMKLALYREFNR